MMAVENWNQFRSTALTLRDILQLAKVGALALPDFQRQYAWTDDHVRGLLASLFKGWPAGLLLLMEAPPDEFFAIRPIEGGPSVDVARIRHLVLDGQQRITALVQAFNRPEENPDGSYWIIDLERFNAAKEITDHEDAFRKIPGRKSVRIAPVGQGMPRSIPLYALRSSREMIKWRDELIDQAGLFAEMSNSEQPSYADSLYAGLNNLMSDSLGRISDYSFPVAVLDRTMDLSSVASIFERLNTRGLPLTTFDLIVAHVYRDGYNLRAKWDEVTQGDVRVQALAGGDPQLSVEVIALRSTGDVRQSALLSLDASDVWDIWPRVIDALGRACEFLIRECGIYSGSELPHRSHLLVLTAIALDFDLNKNKNLLVYWVFSSALTSRFDAAVNTRVVSEYKNLAAVIVSNRVLELATPSAGELVAATKRGASSVWRGLQALIRVNGPREILDGLVPFEIESSATQPTVVTKLAEKKNTSSAPVLGMVLLGPSLRSELEGAGAYRFFQYLESFQPDWQRSLAEQQLLPSVGRENYQNDYDFLEARAIVVQNRLKQLHAAMERYAIKSESAPLEPKVGELDYSRLVDDFLEKGDLRAALETAQSQYIQSINRYGEEHPMSLELGRELSAVQSIAGLHAQASDLLLDLIPRYRRIFGDNSRDVLKLRIELANALVHLGKLPKAIDLLEDISSETRRGFGSNSWEFYAAMRSLGAALAGSGQHSKAVRILEEAMYVARTSESVSHLEALETELEILAELSMLGETKEVARLVADLRTRLETEGGLASSLLKRLAQIEERTNQI